MKIAGPLALFSLILLSCNSTMPVTANPDHSTYTSGAAGSAQITDGPLHEGPKKGADSSKAIPDTTRRQLQP